jgi:hypothetical protein
MRMPEPYYCSPSSITSTWGNTRQRSCSSGSLASSSWSVCWPSEAGFFLHMVQGKAGTSSAGVLVTNNGAALLTLAILFLVYLIIVG